MYVYGDVIEAFFVPALDIHERVSIAGLLNGGRVNQLKSTKSLPSWSLHFILARLCLVPPKPIDTSDNDHLSGI